MLLILKYIKIIFFYFLKIIFKISALKHIKKILFFNKKNLNFYKLRFSTYFHTVLHLKMYNYHKEKVGMCRNSAVQTKNKIKI